MSFLENFGWYTIGVFFLLCIVSYLHYKAFVEKKGIKFLLIPFFTILGLYTLLSVSIFSQPCSGEECLGIAIIVFGFPIVLGFLVVPALLVAVIFYFFRIKSFSQLKMFWLVIFLVALGSILIFGFAPGDNLGIETRAVASGDPSICDTLISEVGIFSVARGNNLRFRETCKVRVALKTDNFKICSTLKDLEMKSICMSWVVARTGEIGECNSLQEPGQSTCKKVLDTTHWIKENYCSSGSYSNCMKSVCGELFTYNKYNFYVESTINACLKRLAVEKNNEMACDQTLPVPRFSDLDEGAECKRSLFK